MSRFEAVVTQGKFYTNPSERYKAGSVVICDRCCRRGVTRFYGKDDLDLCLACASAVLQSMDSGAGSAIPRVPLPGAGGGPANPFMSTFMHQSMYGQGAAAAADPEGVTVTLMLQSAMDTEAPGSMDHLFKPFARPPSPKPTPRPSRPPGSQPLTRMLQFALRPTDRSLPRGPAITTHLGAAAARPGPPEDEILTDMEQDIYELDN